MVKVSLLQAVKLMRGCAVSALTMRNMVSDYSVNNRAASVYAK